MIENGISASEDKIVGKRFESFYWISIYNIYALLFNYSLFTLESNTLTHLWICCDIWGWITGNCLICLWKISFPLFEQTPLLTAIEIRTKWRIDKFMVFLIPLTSSSVSLPSYLLLELFVCFRYRPWCEFGHECGLWIHWSVIELWPKGTEYCGNPRGCWNETDFSLLFIQLFLNSCIRVGMDIVLNLRNHMCSVIYQNEHFLRDE